MAKIDYRCLQCGWAEQIDVPAGPAPVGNCPACATQIEPTAQLDEEGAQEPERGSADPMIPKRPMGQWATHKHGEQKKPGAV